MTELLRGADEEKIPNAERAPLAFSLSLSLHSSPRDIQPYQSCIAR